MFLLAVPPARIVSKKTFPATAAQPVAAENSKRVEVTSVRFAD
jgi:hypothetical protein